MGKKKPCTNTPRLLNFLILNGQKLKSTGSKFYQRPGASRLPHTHFRFIPTGIRAANGCQTDALIQSASLLSPRPSLILSINNPATSSFFLSNEEMDYTARLKANKLLSLLLSLADSHWAPNE